MTFIHKGIYRIFLWGMLLTLFVSCATTPTAPPPRHSEFTKKNILSLHAGMATGEVEAIFGQPDFTSVRTFGAKTDKTWNGLIYTYNMGKHSGGKYENTDNTNILVFSLSFSPPRLNHWNINLAYEDPPVHKDKDE